MGVIDCGVVTVRADDMFDDNIFFLIKMPLEFVEISRVNVGGDNINLTAADVDSFDVAVCGAKYGVREMKWWEKEKEREREKKDGRE